MNILMVTNNYTPYSGGVVSSICATTQALQEQGHTVHIATLDFGTQENDAYFVHRLYCPLKFWYYKNPVAVPWRAQAQLEVLVRTLKPALIHSHHPFLLGIAAVHVAKKYAIPIIFTHHTLYDEYSHYLPLPTFLLKPFINYVVTKYCQNVDGIIAPSSFVKNRLVHHQIQKSIAVIPSGILPLFYPGIFAPKNSIKNRKITLLTISRFMPAKNITFLLDMFAYLDHSRFQLIIGGFGAQEEFLQNYAYRQKKFSPEEVIFVIKPSKIKIAQLYQQADIFVFASITETQGLVIMEALAAGTPVIATNRPVINEVIKEGENGFLTETSAEMAQKITWLSNNENVWEQLQKNAFKSAYTYQITKTAEKLVQFYKKISHL